MSAERPSTDGRHKAPFVRKGDWSLLRPPGSPGDQGSLRARFAERLAHHGGGGADLGAAGRAARASRGALAAALGAGEALAVSASIRLGARFHPGSVARAARVAPLGTRVAPLRPRVAGVEDKIRDRCTGGRKQRDGAERERARRRSQGRDAIAAGQGSSPATEIPAAPTPIKGVISAVGLVAGVDPLRPTAR